MSPETWASIGVSAVTGACGMWAARAARRTPRQERRDDFTAVKDALNQRIDQLGAEQAAQRQIIGDQAEALRYLVVRVRSLVAYIRKAGMEPPAAPPMSDRARDHLHHIDV